MVFVKTPTTKPTFPEACLCCLTPVTSQRFSVSTWTRSTPFLDLVIPHFRQITLAIPYCPECLRHIAWREDGGNLGLIVRPAVVFLLTTFFVGVGCLFGLVVVGALLESLSVTVPVARSAILWPAALVGLIAGAMAAVVSLRRRLRLRSPPVALPHVRSTASFDVLDWNREALVLEIDNSAWASRFLLANPGSATVARPRNALETAERWLYGLGLLVTLYLIYEAWRAVLR